LRPTTEPARPGHDHNRGSNLRSVAGRPREVPPPGPRRGDFCAESRCSSHQCREVRGTAATMLQCERWSQLANTSASPTIGQRWHHSWWWRVDSGLVLGRTPRVRARDSSGISQFRDALVPGRGNPSPSARSAVPTAGCSTNTNGVQHPVRFLSVHCGKSRNVQRPH